MVSNRALSVGVSMDTHNQRALLSLALMGVESAREGLDTIHLHELEENLPEPMMTALFDSVCLVDEALKVAKIALSECLEGNPENHPHLDIDTAFGDCLDAPAPEFIRTPTARLFYLIRDRLNTWKLHDENGKVIEPDYR